MRRRHQLVDIQLVLPIVDSTQLCQVHPKLLCLLGGVQPRIHLRECQSKQLTLIEHEGCFRTLAYSPNTSGYGKTSHAREVFPCMGSRTTYGNGLYMEKLSCMESRPVYGKTSHAWNAFPLKGCIPMHEKSSQMMEDYPCMGGLLSPGQTSHMARHHAHRQSWSMCRTMPVLPHR